MPSRSERGALRGRHERWCGMRWTRQCQKTNDAACGRRSRVVLTPRRWRQVSWKYPRGDGDNKARSPRRARRKPLKPLRREGRIASAEPVCSCAFSFVHLAHETAGAARTRLSLRPLFSRDKVCAHNSGAERRENVEVCPSSSFRGDAKHRAWNLEITRCAIAHLRSGALRTIPE